MANAYTDRIRDYRRQQDARAADMEKAKQAGIGPAIGAGVRNALGSIGDKASLAFDLTTGMPAEGVWRGINGDYGNGAPATQSTTRQQHAATQTNSNPAAPTGQAQAAAQQNAAAAEKRSLGGATTGAGGAATGGNAQSSFVNWTTNSDGTRTGTWNVSGTDQRASITLPGGFNPQDAARAQQGQPGGNFGFQPNYQQIGQNTYMNDRGLMIQGDQGTADYMYRFRSTPSSPVFFDPPQRQQAQQQMPMPIAPSGGWKTAKAVYQTQMDAWNKAQDRAKALEIAQMQDAQAGARLGIDRDQLRQQLALGLLGHGIQQGQLYNDTVRRLTEQETAAIQRRQLGMQLGLQQQMIEAANAGNTEEYNRLAQIYQGFGFSGSRGKDSSEGTAKSGWKVETIKGPDGSETPYRFNSGTGEAVLLNPSLTNEEMAVLGVLANNPEEFANFKARDPREQALISAQIRAAQAKKNNKER